MAARADPEGVTAAAVDDSTPSIAGAELARLLEDDPADLYENAPCGYLSMLPGGEIVKVNRTLTTWLGRDAGELVGTHFADLLTVGGRVYNETHLAPLLRMQGAAREVALDLALGDGAVLPCLLNAVEVRDAVGAPALIRVTLFEVSSRRRYERALLAAQRTAAESENRSRTLHQMVSQLAAAVSVHDVAEALVERGRAAVDAGGGALWLLPAAAPGDPQRGRPDLRLVAAAGISTRLRDELEAAGGSRLLRPGGVRVVSSGAEVERSWPGLAAAMHDERIDALVLVPVTADGRHRGGLVLVLGASGKGELISLTEPGNGGDLSPADADLLATMGRQAGQALERVWLYEETARQAARSAFLLDAARLMSAAAGVTETVERLAELAVPRLADVCVIDLLTEHGPVRPAARHADRSRQPLVDRLRDLHLPSRGGAHPGAQAVESGRTVWISEITDAVLGEMTQDERHLELVRGLELTGIVAVPLMADGRALGVLTLGVDRRRAALTAADVEVAEQLALQVSQVVDKAQRLELETQTSHTLQANLLPPAPPPVPGLEVAVRYVAASRGADVGGDFYDVVPLPAGGGVALAVGDVVGHDITAAAVMGQLRSVHRVLLADRPGPSAIIDRFQAGWGLLGLQRMATAMFGSLDPATGQLRLASAGHLSPLIVSASGAEFLEVRPSRMLGAPPSASPAVEWAGVLPVGATLVLFTDGLVESRTADIDEGLALLLRAAEAAHGDGPDQLCDRLLAELIGDHRADDVALLAIARV
ncbi:SpoIIE family protein phosphatase [Trujillonella endophytica]|uniref:Serine/threonine-protein kinase RsbW n=1 Tax=Trujillonella endophytica TaxID=673521 RepID=A0A1H8VKD3_9ACTN|nr:SpoIIE family protein phosphatase [Trujillella endophytica]SEP15912.1 serine/threonine-protein kinase RsbW [Trujillella endophytica]